MRVEKPSGTALPTQLQASDRTEETLLPDEGAPRARAGTDRGWTIEKTIVGPPPPAEAPRPPAPAPLAVVKPPKLAGLPPIRPLHKPVVGLVPPPMVPAPRSTASSRTSARSMAAIPFAPGPANSEATTASGAAPVRATRKQAALIVDDSGSVTSPVTPPAPRLRAASPVLPAARPTGAQSVFPRSAAERAGVAEARATPRRASSVRRAAVPARAGSPRLAPAIERSVELAQGSVTAPMPVVTDATQEPSPQHAGPEATPAARRRPPTVEFPTLEPSDLAPAPAGESEQTFRDLPAASPVAAVPADKPLPSIYAIVDRRHAPPPQAPQAVPVVTVHPSSSGASSRRSHLSSGLASVEPQRAPSSGLRAGALSRSISTGDPADFVATPTDPGPAWSVRHERPLDPESEAVPEPIPPEMLPVARPETHAGEAAARQTARSMPAPRRAPAASYAAPAYAAAHAPIAAHAPVAHAPVAHAPVRRRAAAPAPEPRRAEAAVRRARSRSGVRPAASFSAAEAAFFAEGEDRARAEWAAIDDDLEHVSLKRPGLWRRLTRRR